MALEELFLHGFEMFNHAKEKNQSRILIAFWFSVNWGIKLKQNASLG